MWRKETLSLGGNPHPAQKRPLPPSLPPSEVHRAASLSPNGAGFARPVLKTIAFLILGKSYDLGTV